MTNNFMLVSGVQQSDSVVHMHASILLQILFPFMLLYDTEQSSLCCRVGPRRLPILNIAVRIRFFSLHHPICWSHLQTHPLTSPIKLSVNIYRNMWQWYA